MDSGPVSDHDCSYFRKLNNEHMATVLLFIIQ